MKVKMVSPALVITILVAIGYFVISINRVEEVEKEPRSSGALEALTFWTKARAYPGTDIPAEEHYRQYRYVKSQLSKSSRSAENNGVWEAMGPLNVPGRMISLAVNPQNAHTLYAGAATGGLWVTHNATIGSNWRRVHTGFPTLGVMAIAIDPADTNKMYIGTGETYGYNRSKGGYAIRTTRGSYGIGILKTTDGGDTWTKSLDWTQNQQRGIQCIRMNPLNSNVLYAASSVGIYKTNDAGAHWQLVLDVLMGEDIVIHPTDTSKVLVSCGNLGSPGSGIYKTSDAGQNWEKLGGGLPNFSGKTLMDYFASDPDIVFASVADSLSGIGLFRTDNFGDTWTLVFGSNANDVPSYQGFFSHWTAVHPININHVVYAGVNIYKSYNGGASLNYVGGPHVDHHNFAHDPFNANILYIACDGGVYRSTDFGDSYVNIGYGLQTAQFYNGFSSSSSDSNLALGGLQDNGLVVYRGTPDWQNISMGDGCWTAANPLNDVELYAESQYNNIRKSTNRGNSFSSATSGLYGDAAFVAPYAVAPSNPSILYSGRQSVFKTYDAANSWQVTGGGALLDGNYILSMAISPRDPDKVYVGTAPTRGIPAHIFRTTDGGDTWFNVTGALPDRYPMDIAVDPRDYKTAFVVYGGYGSGHVYKTTDGGDTWQDVSGALPDVPTLSVTIDPINSAHVYIGNDLGVYASTNAGDSWEVYNNGLPEAVMAMDLNALSPNRKLRVATHGNGAYQRPLLFKPAVYLVYSLNTIPNVVLVDVALTFSATAFNIGTEMQSDTSTVQLRITDETGNEVYSNLQTVVNLDSKESQSIAFEGSFSPENPGDYFLEFIRFATAQQPEQDTTRQMIRAISGTTIAQAVVKKEYCAYQEISGGTTLNFGDDDYSAVVLPFPFEYDGYAYDKVQICTNGWLEFGAGANGTERGLSTSQQIGSIGANENGRLATTAHPKKALGPWWEDLNTSGGGQLRYATTGTAPNRMFIVQWKNMRAYYSDATTTRLNFQVRLYESTNRIEYHYGPVVLGTFSGADLGAMIGFKDHLGGDYHYYDIYAGGTGLAGDIVTDLSPLRDWPGPDSCFVIYTGPSSVDEHDLIVPANMSLYQNYPNPFNPATTIKYYLPKTENVTLRIYNSLGREVRTLIDKKQLDGYHTVTWDGKDNAGRTVSSGVYLYRLSAGEKIRNRKMMFIK